MSDATSEDEDNIVLSAEMMDREERKALKAKQKAEEEAKKIKPTQDEIEAALAQSKLAEAQKAKKMRLFKVGGGLAVVGVLGWLGYYLFAPYKAGMPYGICKTFLELNVQFPQTLKIRGVRNFGEFIRVWYGQTDAFGEYRMENIQCYFRSDPVTGAALDKVMINRREVDQQRVEVFNKSIPVILANPPDLNIPPPTNSLKDIQFDTDSFRFQLNIRKR